MDDSLYANALAPFLGEVERLRPAGAEVFDAHTHRGRDGEGRSLSLPQLLALLDAAGARRACVFPLHDPERAPAYRLPNDRVLAWAGESEGRLLPFCRLDPAEDPVSEGERCLAAGARGIKLHPGPEAFGFASPEMDGIFALAESAAVPILIHAGRGLPPLGDELVDLTLRHPDVVLILAHGAICDQGIITSRLADHPGVLYDISCFFPLDVIELLARAPIERVVFASDPPYGLPATSLYMALRVAAHAGLDEDAVRGMLAGRLARVYGYGSLAGPAMFMGSAEQAQAMLEMALAACRDPDPGDVGEALETIEVALTAAGALLAAQTEDGTRAAID